MAANKKSDPGQYTKPELRDKIKEQVTEGDQGGNPGQWSARKAQLVTQEYEKEGGGYKHERTEAQESLKKWGDEKWHTSDSKQARRKGGTTRYLPDKAWSELSEDEKKATNKKKQQGSRAGKKLVSNTKVASSARKKAVKKTAAKKTVAKKATTKKAATKKTAAKRK